MELVTKQLKDIKPYAKNPRKNDNAVAAVAESIRQCEYIAPIIIDENGVILAGHTRYKALLSLGYTEAECVVKAGLTDEQKRKYRLLDNKTNELAEWDFDLLMDELDGLDFDGFDFGFDIDDEEPGEVVEDDYDAEPPVEPKAKLGDIYQLGRHRLMCGDSTKAGDVERLMGGQKADITFCSPPYNAMAGFSANKKMKAAYMREGGVYEDYEDDLEPSAYAEFLHKALDNALTFSDDALFNIGYTKGALHGTALFLGECAEYFAGAISWVKSNAFTPVFDCQLGILSNKSEPIYIFNKDGRRKFLHPQWSKTTQMPNVVETENASSTNDNAKIHGATFPVSLAEYVARNFSEDSVIDLFGGTGTTLIACEQLDRTCYMMELSPQYIDVIIDRWEKFTGEKAVKLN